MTNVKICAEIGCNHQGSLEIAKKMIREAKLCGCDLVKFQKRHIDSIPQEVGDKPYLSENSFGKTYRDHRIALEFDIEDWNELISETKKIEIGIFGTAFDEQSAWDLTSLKLPYLKIGSGQIRNADLLYRIKALAESQIIISTGMCTEEQANEAIKILHPAIVCHTTSSYPCPEDEVNLKWLRKQLIWQTYVHPDYELGLSGHYSAGNGAIEAAAVALGVTYIERHFTLDRTWKGTDQSASLEPIGMINVVKAVRSIERALGDGVKKVMPSEVKLLEKLNAEKYTPNIFCRY